MTALSTLGGNNSFATGINDRGQIVGLGETGTKDPSCTPPQVFDFEGVIWGPRPGGKQALPPVSGDAISAVIGINDRGQPVGGSGMCAQGATTIFVHPVLWRNGAPVSLPTLGGAFNNLAWAVNERGEIVGGEDLLGDSTQHAVLWRRGKVYDLGTLTGDTASNASAINNDGQIVGDSWSGSAFRAFLWQNGTMTDLNSLVRPRSRYYLIYGNDINDRGVIIGEAYDTKTGNLVGFVATPTDQAITHAELNATPIVHLPDRIRQQVIGRQRSFLGHLLAR